MIPDTPLSDDVTHSRVYEAWRNRPHNTSKEFAQVADDVWITDCPVAPHMDSTASGLVTYGLVILNELDLELVYCHRRRTLRPGSTYRIDGRIMHSAEPPWSSKRPTQTGLFAALIWDMPAETTLDTFYADASARLQEWLLS